MRLLIAGMCLFTMLFASCASHNESEEDAQTFTITSPDEKDTTVFQDYVCQIRSIQHIELRALEKGYLQNIFVDEGQFVKKGQPLFQIMPVVYESEMLKAKAELSYAEIEYRNTKNLADSNIVSKAELALAKARLDKSKAELSLAEAHLSFTRINAPFDGIVGRFNDVRLGSLVDEGDLLTTLSDNSKIWVYFNVPEAEYLSFATEQKDQRRNNVKLQLSNNEIYALEGQIETIEADFNNETGNIAFRATFDNPDKMLRHGQTGNILMPRSYKNAMLIPQKATFEILDQKYVYIVDENNVLKSRQIEVDQELPHMFIIKQGITAKDKILVDGLRKVKNGQHINGSFKSLQVILKEMEALQAE